MTKEIKFMTKYYLKQTIKIELKNQRLQSQNFIYEYMAILLIKVNIRYPLKKKK